MGDIGGEFHWDAGADGEFVWCSLVDNSWDSDVCDSRDRLVWRYDHNDGHNYAQPASFNGFVGSGCDIIEHLCGWSEHCAGYDGNVVGEWNGNVTGYSGINLFLQIVGWDDYHVIRTSQRCGVGDHHDVAIRHDHDACGEYQDQLQGCCDGENFIQC